MMLGDRCAAFILGEEQRAREESLPSRDTSAAGDRTRLPE
jgi:hypothetical protein